MLFGSAAPVTPTTNAPLFLLPNGTFIVELVIFIIVLGIIARVILPPISGALREREAKIRGGLEAGEEGRAEADRLERSRRAVLDEARAEARSIIEGAQSAAEAKREAARKRGQAEYERQFALAQGSIEQERQQTIDQVAGSLETLVVDAAQRIVGAPVDPTKHRDAIESVRAQLGAADGA